MNVLALGLSLAAGLSTGIGGLLGIVLKGRGNHFIGGALGFSAGIMITVSLSDILPNAVEILTGKIGDIIGVIFIMLAVTAGMLIGGLIDTFIPQAPPSSSQGMYRLGIFSMISLIAHNLPEGIAVYVSGSADAAMGVSLALAIGMHNIPEGIAVALPIYTATGKAGKSVGYAFLSGLAEPLGGVLAWLILGPLVGPLLLEYTMAVVSGLMLYVAMWELIPSACEAGGFRAMSLGGLLGVLVMSLSIYLI